MTGAAGTADLTRGHKKKERTRRRLIAAAVDVIAERGEAFSITDVVAEAGVANGTFYNYFQDREELIDAVVPEVLAAFAAEGALAVRHEDPAVRFATISALALTRAATAPEAIRVVLRLGAVQRAIGAGQAVDHLRRDLLAGAGAGRFAFGDVDTALDVVAGSLLMAARRTVNGEVDGAYHCELIERLLCSLGIAPDEATTIAVQAIDTAVGLQNRPTSGS